jgi:ribonuclease P protein component
VLHSSSLQFRYHFFENTDNEIKIGFITPKKIMKKAVSRNRAKRRLRESYRKHQHILTDFFSDRPGGVHGVFISKKEDIPFCDINAEVEQLLLGLTKKINSQIKQKDQNEPSTSHKII